MPKRNLRIVRTAPPRVLGVCEFCNMTFHSDKPDLLEAGSEVRAQFDAHKCKQLDASQNAVRVVREATKD
jgi:hypothetical protein